MSHLLVLILVLLQLVLTTTLGFNIPKIIKISRLIFDKRWDDIHAGKWLVLGICLLAHCKV